MLGMSDMLKEGSKHFSGKDEALLKNIEAAKKLATILRSSLGPNGMNKMVINHLEKLFVTNDAATIMKELDVIHPAARMCVLASQQQEQEVGDATNLVVVLAGEFLAKCEDLLQTGLHPSDIIAGFERAGKKAQEVLEGLATHKVEDIKDIQQVARVLKAAIGSKQYGFQDTLAPLIAEACIQVTPKNPANFNVDNVRVTKILGGGTSDTHVVKGFVIARGVEGTIKHVTNAKIAIYTAGLEPSKTDTKGLVLIKNADDLLNFSVGEEKAMEELIKSISETGVKVVVVGATISDMALHFIERYQMMAIKIPSKFQLRRVCKAVGATPLVKIGAPTQEELGYCDVVSVDEIGSQQVCVFRQSKDDSGISTLVVRGSTDNIMDDIERAIDDGVNVYKGLCKDPRFVPGAAASEVELASQIAKFADSIPGLEQYALRKYAEAFEVIPRTLADNAGLNATELISNLYAAHATGNANAGLDIETGEVKDATELAVFDLHAAKANAVRLATNTAITILRVDQIIMSKPAGGPKVPKQGPMDADD